MMIIVNLYILKCIGEQDLQLHDREQDKGNNGYWPSQRNPIPFPSPATN